MKTETYTVKFIVSQLGSAFVENKSEEFYSNSKSAHKQAEKFIQAKYKGSLVRIVSVVFH